MHLHIFKVLLTRKGGLHVMKSLKERETSTFPVKWATSANLPTTSVIRKYNDKRKEKKEEKHVSGRKKSSFILFSYFSAVCPSLHVCVYDYI